MIRQLLDVRRELEASGEIGVQQQAARPVRIRTDVEHVPAPANDMPSLEKNPPRTDRYREPISAEPEPPQPPVEAQPEAAAPPADVPSEPPLEAVQDDAPQVQLSEQIEAALYRDEVTQGLEQLLSEWGIFKKKSGLLGMLGVGSIGIEHGLYKKISGMPVLDILAGGKKGASVPAYAVKDIRAYVAGWKEDYGVEPNQDETFELYLRRMIDHILSLEQELGTPANDNAEQSKPPLTAAA